MRRCTRCIMTDESDKTIHFDDYGICNYCTDAFKTLPNIYFPNEAGEQKLNDLLIKVKEDGKGKPYDCLMGISGGLDSSYLAYLGAVKWGLKIAAVHIDDGYDTEISKQNIKNLCDSAGIKLITIKPDPEQYNALVRAYMKAGVPNLAVPQDNILFAYLYDFARKNHIRYFLSGDNFALECILQKGNTWDAYDLVNLKAIHKKFGDFPINKLTFISSPRKILDSRLGYIKTVSPLNYINYNRNRAFAELKDFCGFEYYGRKHLENHFTAFVQTYWFPKKFGVDKRTSHLSSMIVSGQMTREEALAELEKPIYEEAYMDKVKKMICENMNMSLDELDKLVTAPGKQHDEYPTEKFVPFIRRIIETARKHGMVSE